MDDSLLNIDQVVQRLPEKQALTITLADKKDNLNLHMNCCFYPVVRLRMHTLASVLWK